MGHSALRAAWRDNNRNPLISRSAVIYTYTDGFGGDIYSADDAALKLWGTGLNNGGGHTSLAPGVNERALLRYNLSAIPAGSTCLTADLYVVHDSGPEAAPNPATGNIFYISAANGNWVAGTKNIAPASAGENCWNGKAADGLGGISVPWAGSIGCSTAGVDYVNTVIGSYSLNPGSAIGTIFIISLTPAVVQGWFGIINNGIIVRGTASEIHWGQANNATPAYRPKLVVTYTL